MQQRLHDLFKSQHLSPALPTRNHYILPFLDWAEGLNCTFEARCSFHNVRRKLLCSLTCNMCAMVLRFLSQNPKDRTCHLSKRFTFSARGPRSLQGCQPLRNCFMENPLACATERPIHVPVRRKGVR
eukprot:3800542-Amphidinium_carterae.1